MHPAHHHSSHEREATQDGEVKVFHKTVKTGLGFGAALAIAISWSVNHSIVWAVVHGLLSWFYVIAYALGGTAQGTW